MKKWTSNSEIARKISSKQLLLQTVALMNNFLENIGFFRFFGDFRNIGVPGSRPGVTAMKKMNFKFGISTKI